KAGAACRRRTREDLAEDGISVAADIEASAILGRDALIRLGSLQRGDVGGVVKPGELARRRHRAVAPGGGVEPAERAGEVDDGGDARDRQRVLPAIGGCAIDVAADEERAG